MIMMCGWHAGWSPLPPALACPLLPVSPSCSPLSHQNTGMTAVFFLLCPKPTSCQHDHDLPLACLLDSEQELAEADRWRYNGGGPKLNVVSTSSMSESPHAQLATSRQSVVHGLSTLFSGMHAQAHGKDDGTD